MVVGRVLQRSYVCVRKLGEHRTTHHISTHYVRAALLCLEQKVEGLVRTRVWSSIYTLRCIVVLLLIGSQTW